MKMKTAIKVINRQKQVIFDKNIVIKNKFLIKNICFKENN